MLNKPGVGLFLVGYGKARVRHFIMSDPQGFSFQADDVLYTTFPVPGLQKRKEIEFNLLAVVDPQSYRDSKQRYNRIKAPFKVKIQVDKAVVGDSGELEKVLVAYSEWERGKLDDPTVHKISFTGARYRRCLQLGYHDTSGIYQVYVLRDMLDNIVGARVLSVEDKAAFDLAFFVNVMKAPSQSAAAANFRIMQILQGSGVLTLNSGDCLNKDLHAFKSHYPHEYVYFYSGKAKLTPLKVQSASSNLLSLF
jgi:hypothetical protein